MLSAVHSSFDGNEELYEDEESKVVTPKSKKKKQGLFIAPDIEKGQFHEGRSQRLRDAIR